MQTATQTAPVSKGRRITGWVLTILPVLMLTFSAVMKLLAPQPVLAEFTRLGYPPGLERGIGILELACTLLFLVPRTSVLGAILLTGYLGGAVATHVRVGDPTWQAILPSIWGVVAWLALYLRDPRLHPLLPLRK